MKKANYNSTTKKGKCIFCELAEGNLQLNGKFWENKNYVAFLSGWPNTEGFTVIMPKKHHSSDVLGMPNKKLQEFILIAKEISQILIGYYDDVGRCGLIIEGTGVDHAHVKLFPMHGTENLKNGTWKQIHSGVDIFFEKYNGYISSNDGPKADEQKIRDTARKIREFIQHRK